MSGLKKPFTNYYLLGLDVGGTKIEALVVDKDMVVRGHVCVPTDVSSAAQAVGSMVAAIQKGMAVALVEPGEVLSIGVGVPGQVQDGEVHHAVNLNLETYPLADFLSAQFNVPVVLENDVRTATLGAYQYLWEQEPVENLAYLSVGTGISAGLILNGALYRGSHGMAGEVGHIVVEPGGQRCNCGAQGCLETVAAGPAIAQQAVQAIRAGQKTSLREINPPTAEAVFQAAWSGDWLAQKIVRQVAGYLSRAIYSLIMTYDVDRVALGGGVFHAGENFLKLILDDLDHLAAQSRLAKSMLPAGKVVLIPKEYRVGGWGAIALAKKAVLNSIPEMEAS